MSKRPRGFCSVCGTTVAIKKDGSAFQHADFRRSINAEVCEGSGKTAQTKADRIREHRAAIEKAREGRWVDITSYSQSAPRGTCRPRCWSFRAAGFEAIAVLKYGAWHFTTRGWLPEGFLDVHPDAPDHEVCAKALAAFREWLREESRKIDRAIAVVDEAKENHSGSAGSER